MLGVRGGLRQFRRYRISFLTKQKAPSALIRYWTGHKGHADEIGEFTLPSTVTDLYANRGIRADLACRQKWCNKLGLGSRWFRRKNRRAKHVSWQQDCEMDYMDYKTDQVVGLRNA